MLFRSAINDEKAVKVLQQKLSTIGTNEAKFFEKEKRKLTKRMAELDKLFSALYEDKVMERITERNYDLMSAKYEKEQLEIDERLRVVDDELIAKCKNETCIVDFLSLIRNYQGVTELTATIINALIDKITVSERIKNADGQLEQIITIHYKFIGSLDSFAMYPPKANRYAYEKVCENCGITFTPGSNVAKYCSTCREEIRREQSNHSKRRSRVKAKQELE